MPLPTGGAVPVPLPVPCGFGVRPTPAFGCLGEWDTFPFRDPGRKRPGWRLFLSDTTITNEQALADIEAGVPVGITPHLTVGAIDQRCTGTVALGRFALAVAGDRFPTHRAPAAGVAGTHPAGEQALFPGLVAGVAKDAPSQPVGPFAVRPPTVATPLWLESAQVLEHHNRRAMHLGKLYNPPADPLGRVFIEMADFGP